MLETYKTSQKEGINQTEYRYLIPDINHVSIADWVSKEITSSKTMLPKSTKEVLDLFQEGRSVIIVNDDGHPVAHAAITLVYDDAKVIEIGGVIVHPSERRRGLGAAATLGAIALGKEKYPGWLQIALCNAASLPLFIKLGAIEMDAKTAQEAVPSEAWEACATCPNFLAAKAQGKICCDTPVSLEAIDPYNQI